MTKSIHRTSLHQDLNVGLNGLLIEYLENIWNKQCREVVGMIYWIHTSIAFVICQTGKNKIKNKKHCNKQGWTAIYLITLNMTAMHQAIFIWLHRCWWNCKTGWQFDRMLEENMNRKDGQKLIYWQWYNKHAASFVIDGMRIDRELLCWVSSCRAKLNFH